MAGGMRDGAERGRLAGPYSPSTGLCQSHAAVRGAAAPKDVLVSVFNLFFFMCFFKLPHAQSSDRSFFHLQEERAVPRNK